MLIRFTTGLWLLISVACTRNGLEPSLESESGTKLSLKSTDSKKRDMEIKASLVGVGDPEYPRGWPGRPSNDSGLPPEEAPAPVLKDKLCVQIL